MAVDTEAKRWGMLQSASGVTISNLVNPNGADLDSKVERLTVLSLYGGITAPVVPSADVSGNIPGSSFTLIRDTGGTIVITLLNDTFIAAGTGPIGTTAQSDTFVQSFVAASSPTNGWNNEISLDNTDLVRTSDTVATITVPATGTYDPLVNETITGQEVQAAILTTSATPISLSNFNILFASSNYTNRKWVMLGGRPR